MTFIKIADLTTASSKSLSDSFLNKLQKTETTQIFGGGNYSYKYDCDYSYKDDRDYSYKDDCDYGYKDDCDYGYKDDCDYSYKDDCDYGGWKK